MPRFINSVRLLLSALVLAGCLSPSEPEEALQLGVVGEFFDTLRVTVPDTVDVGNAFPVQVETYGNGCVRLGPTEVRQGPTGITVLPFDYYTVGKGVVCDDVLLSFQHEALVTADERGPLRVTVQARESPGGPAADFDRLVFVR